MWSMWTGLFVIFPFLNIFRRWSGHIDFKWSMDFLDNINFDASQIFMAVMHDGWITLGRQLFGALFFFIPRSLWIGKPVGSGHAFTTLHGASFTNVSMPFFAEGYVNFGYFGVFLFTIGIAWLCAKLDAFYWYRWKNLSDDTGGFYLIFLGAIIFVLRGDLLSSLAYTIGTMTCYFFILKIGYRNKKVSTISDKQLFKI